MTLQEHMQTLIGQYCVVSLKEGITREGTLQVLPFDEDNDYDTKAYFVINRRGDQSYFNDEDVVMLTVQ